MNYNNITKDNFDVYLEAFKVMLFEVDMFLFENENENNNEINIQIDYEDVEPEIVELYELKKNSLSFNEQLKTFFLCLDIRLKKLIKFSHKNDIFFDYCSFKVYQNTFEERFIDFENKLIDVEKVEFIKNEIETILNKNISRFNLFSFENQTILKNAKIKKIEFLQSISKDFNINIIKRDEEDFFNFNKYKVEVKNGTIENPKHENIFSNNGFILFEHIFKEYIKPIGTKGRLSDIHFFYWSMFNSKPQLIHQRPERFKEWFFENYDNEDLGKIKTYIQVENTDRLKHYSNALDWFKTQS